MLKLYLEEHKAVSNYFKIWGGGLEGQGGLFKNKHKIMIVVCTKTSDKKINPIWSKFGKVRSNCKTGM